MLNEPTIEKLRGLRLGVMADAWVAQGKDPKVSALTFDERFGLLVDAEHLSRDNRRLTRLLTWVSEHLNVLLVGPTGVGKSYVACALGQAACRRGLRVLYRRVPRLLPSPTCGTRARSCAVASLQTSRVSGSRRSRASALRIRR